MTTTGSSPRVTPQVVLGGLIVMFGLAMTADNIGLIEVDRLWSYWPLIIIGFGLVRFLQASTASGHLVGLAAMFVGGVFLAESRFGVAIDLWDFFPLLFVAAGAVMIARAWRGPGRAPEWAERPPSAEAFRDGSATTTGSGSDAATASRAGILTRTDSTISEFAFWSGLHRRVAAPHFRRGDLTAIMGGIELDLRPAGTAGGEAVIDVFVWWGGIDITVPPDWAVSNQAVAVMGAAEDLSTGTQDARHRLIVRGFIIMGGVEIKTA